MIQTDETANTHISGVAAHNGEIGTNASLHVPEVVVQTGGIGTAGFTLVPTTDWHNILNELNALKDQNNTIAGKNFPNQCFKKSKFLIFVQAKTI